MEERLRNVEIKQALIDQRLEESIVDDEQFRRTVIETLSYLKERDIKVMSFIESHMERDKAKAELWLELKKKLLTSGVWGLLVFIISLCWYAIQSYLNSPQS